MGLNVVHDLCHMISYVRRVINTLIRVSLYRHWSIIRGRCHYLSGWSIMNRVMIIIVIRDHSLIKRVCHNYHHTHYRHWHQHNLYLTTTHIQTALTFILTWTHKNSFNHNNSTNNKQSKYSKKTHNYNKWKQNINNSLLSTLMVMCVFVMGSKCRMRQMLIWGDH